MSCSEERLHNWKCIESLPKNGFRLRRYKCLKKGCTAKKRSIEIEIPGGTHVSSLTAIEIVNKIISAEVLDISELSKQDREMLSMLRHRLR